MSRKFWFLTTQSLLKKIKTKTFIIVNILLLIAFSSLMNIDRIVLFFGGNFNKENNIMIVDNTYKSYDLIKDQIENGSTIIDNGLKFKVTKLDKIEKKKVKKDEDIMLVINNNEENTIDVNMITYGYIDSSVYQIITSSLNKVKQTLAIENLDISKEELSKLNESVSIKREYIQKGKNENEESMEYVLSIVTPIIIFPFFMLVTLVIQMIGAEINEEKSTRSMEIIISNVSAKVHFFSKVLASNLFVIIQCILFIIYSLIGALIRGGTPKIDTINNVGQVSKVTNMINDTGIFNNVISYIPFVLILMLVTLLGYSLLAGILASMTTNMEDFQQLQTPMMVILLVGFYLSIMSAMFDGSLFIRIISYIPFISAILSPSLLLSGVIGIKDIILSTLLMIVVIYLLIKYGLKIYKEGILNYSSNKLWKKMFKALKEKN
ncbi:MAG: ABC transporter permease [Bacilli bacterium]|nr:ABC transporter permease [Bacilli bacterium]